MKGGMPIVGEGGSVEQWPSCLTNQPCMDTQNTQKQNTQNTLEHRNNNSTFCFAILDFVSTL